MEAHSSLLCTNAKVRLSVCHSSYDAVHTTSASGRNLEIAIKLSWLFPYIDISLQRGGSESCHWTHSATSLQHPSESVRHSAWVKNQRTEWLNMGTFVPQRCCLSHPHIFFPIELQNNVKKWQVITCPRFCCKQCASQQLWKATDLYRTWGAIARHVRLKAYLKTNPCLKSKLISIIIYDCESWKTLKKLKRNSMSSKRTAQGVQREIHYQRGTNCQLVTCL